MGVLARLFGRHTDDTAPNETRGGSNDAVTDGGATNDHSHHVPDDTDVVAAFVDRLRDDDLTEDQRATLRRELGGVPRSHEVKFQHLQARVADFAAYSDAIEEFIDTNGTARDVLAELDDIETRLTDRLDTLETDLETAATAREDLADQLEDIRDRLDTVERLEHDIDALETQLETLEDTHESDVADLAAAREDAVTELEHSHANLQHTHRDDINELEDTIADVSEGMRRELEELQADTADLEERWNRLEGVLAPR